MRTTGFALRLAALATALVVGPTTLAPGTASAPTTTTATASTALGLGGMTTAARHYDWKRMQWDFAWEFGESLDSDPYRGADIQGGQWVATGTGTGRVVKWGGGIEFHTGKQSSGTPDRGSASLTLREKPARFGRWELRERYRDEELNSQPRYEFVAELIPDNPASYDCGRHNLTIARGAVGGSSIEIGVNSGSSRWTRTLTGYGQPETVGRLLAVQVTPSKITWYVNGTAKAALTAPAAIPDVPMTVRMRIVGNGDTEMKKQDVMVDWVRHYNLEKGLGHPRVAGLQKGTFSGDC